jgi:outer membrane protein assembly factor BamB
VAWSVAATCPPSIVVADRTVYAYDPAETAVLAIDATDGSLRWRHGLDGPAARSLLFDRRGDRLHVVSGSGRVQVVASDGTAGPHATVDGRVGPGHRNAAAAPAPGGVYVASTSTVARVRPAATDDADADDAVETVAAGGAVDGLSVAGERLLLAGGTTVAAVHAPTGIGLWKRSIDEPGPEGGTSASGSASASASVSADADPDTDADGTVALSPAVTDGSVYAVADGQVVALDAGDGRERWRARTDRAAPPVVADGLAYVRVDGGIVARDAATGDRRWRFDSDRRAPLAVPVGADGRLYTGECVGGQARLFCLDAASGEVVWTHDGLSDLHSLVPAGDLLVAKSGNRLVGLREA